MLNDVKAVEMQSESTFGGVSWVFGGAVGGAFWMLYFLLCIALVGGTFGYAMALPLCLAGIFYRPFWILGRRTMCVGVDILLRMQPWLNVSHELSALPKDRTIATYSNHRSHLDMFILLAHIPTIRVIAKRELFNIPFLGVMMRVLSNIPLKKNDPQAYRRAFEISAEAIKKGDHVHFFPEMTRCPAGFVGTLDFQLTHFQVLLKAGVPIYPIVFENTDDIWPKGNFTLRTSAKNQRQITVRTLSPVDPGQFQTADDLREHCKRLIDTCSVS